MTEEEIIHADGTSLATKRRNLKRCLEEFELDWHVAPQRLRTVIFILQIEIAELECLKEELNGN